MDETEKCLRLMEEIIDICENIGAGYKNIQRENSSFKDNVNKQHYTITFPKYLPHKVQVNGMLKDRANLSADEREAVRDQEAIDKARERLYLQNKQKIQNSLL